MPLEARPAKVLPLRLLLPIALLFGAVGSFLAGCASEPPRKPAPVTKPTAQQPVSPRGDAALPAPIEIGPIRHIGVLLPQSGQWAGPAAALRDGLLAAYYNASPSDRPTLSFFDASSPSDTVRLYREAVANGADLVVGPLQKEGVEALMRGQPGSVPILALNRVEGGEAAPTRFFMFGLSPEDEATEAAERAWADGHRVALIFKPQDAWGERIGRSFNERWSALGGALAASAEYDPNAHEFVQPIGQLLGLKQSQERHTRLQIAMGRPLEFQPRRRQDASFIFLVAQDRQAREIWPQLQFAVHSELPVYATSSVYSGAKDRGIDAELAGILFPDLPWLLRDDPRDPLARSTFAASQPEVMGPYARLYAMGIDTYELATRLGQLARQPGSTLAGRTGTLSLDAQRRVTRRLLWARMSESGPRLVGPSDTRAPGSLSETATGASALR